MSDKTKPVCIFTKSEVAKAGNIVKAGVQNGTFLQDLCKLALNHSDRIPSAKADKSERKAWRADCLATAQEIAKAAGSDKFMAARIAIVLELPRETISVVKALEAKGRASRDKVLTALRFVRKSGKTPEQGAALALKGAALGKRAAADPFKHAVKALEALRDAKRGKVREAAIDALAALAKVA